MAKDVNIKKSFSYLVERAFYVECHEGKDASDLWYKANLLSDLENYLLENPYDEACLEKIECLLKGVNVQDLHQAEDVEDPEMLECEDVDVMLEYQFIETGNSCEGFMARLT